MRQSVLIIFRDDKDELGRVSFRQTENDLVTSMKVTGVDPSEFVKLMKLVNDLSMQALQEVAMAREGGQA